MPDGFSGKITGNTSRFKRSSPMEAVSHHEKRSVILKKLFISTFYLSAFTFGGGYVIVTLMKKTFVDQYH